ncbi:MICAL-like protein 1 isoform X2 [Lutzomyia longipalpis]|uniref:MICAL-like protein 1 isoform X2 n=1 Tax=Lutzomyia longipalpis TaxID=7200 RepID=UPI0024837485|nr:MICAL-like protein 1 isoform X2 [Lutzomyia longipalpis]XP_055681303.1 MICAL-like protein 1 isoform X2 [Lutzomyia longipalpis]XP_055681304.1 MICAL-like protein 1 isoform X2 [Lutzomyia longipalpis]
MSAKQQLSHGMLRREPCFKCKLPVFLAERLTIDGRNYHRTCLKCARCGHQLTPGSFYETEVDAEFCCEVCPDEEATHRGMTAYEEDDEEDVEEQGSCAFPDLPGETSNFEKQYSLLKKSLSDEEKRESLEKLKGKDQKSMLSFIATQFDGGKENPDEETQNVEYCSSKKTDMEELEYSHKTPKSDIISEDDFNKEKCEIVEEVKDTLTDTTDVGEPLRTNNSTEKLNNDTSLEDKLSKIVLVDDKIKSPCEVSSSEIPCVTKDDEDIVIVDNCGDKQRVSDEFQEGMPQDDTPPNVPACKTSFTEVPIVEHKSVDSVAKDTVAHATDSQEPPASSATVPDDEIIEPKASAYPEHLNPFDSDDGAASSDKKTAEKAANLNPFDSDDEEIEAEKVKKNEAKSSNPFEDSDDEATSNASPRIVKPSPRRTPVPTPRKTVPNVRKTLDPNTMQHHLSVVPPGAIAKDLYGSCASLNSSMSARGDSRGSMNSLSSCSTAGGITPARHKKGKAPLPPASIERSPIPSERSTPKTSPRMRKKRPAPAPPVPKKCEADDSTAQSCETKMRLIPLDAELMMESTDAKSEETPEHAEISYRRKIVPLEASDLLDAGDEMLHERQWEKLKDNKESKNRNRRSNVSFQGDEVDTVYGDKSSHGKWKKRKGPAPALPVPPKRVLQMLPLQEILHELEVIDVQQQGLEKQGIILEKIIRERCEGDIPEGGTEETTLSRDTLSKLPTQNTKEVEDLIMQLFDLVNEKNELFRRQAELMYLRRQHRLEQEQIDLEYEIRVLMAQPERNKTDSDKSKEEALISRLVEVVQLRNEVVDNLEMDRLREAEEDLSIKQEIEKHTAKREEDFREEVTTKLSKKEKKKLKEAKKSKKKSDVDKDDDETESRGTKERKKKKFIII